MGWSTTCAIRANTSNLDSSLRKIFDILADGLLSKLFPVALLDSFDVLFDDQTKVVNGVHLELNPRWEFRPEYLVFVIVFDHPSHVIEQCTHVP